ncbi:MAG TPA: ATP phosphoribosyltransferase [Methanocorpusculum sp.]|nr:ATP phosphoribosyltransferase [Methanocorpusculum sp.]
MHESSKIRLAIPNKGRIAAPVNELMDKAGIHIRTSADRQLIAKTIDPQIEILFVRPIDIPIFVSKGVADIGITGIDMVVERECERDVINLLNLKFGAARLVLAVPDSSPISSVQDLEGLKVATEFPNICRNYFSKHNVNIELIEMNGACEAAPQLGVADAIVDLTSSGTTLEINKLRIIDELFSSTTYLISNKLSISKKREKIDEILLAFKSVIAARDQCYLMMNIEKDNLNKILSYLPSLGGPTIMDIAGSNLIAVHVVVKRERVYQLINQLKLQGAQGILVLDITRMVR